VLRYPALSLLLLGTGATVISAPIDEFWHLAFGRDAVLWSPPHMLGVAALFVVAVGLLLEARELPARLGRILMPLASALLLGVLLVPVMEYETDVPQFPLLWYLPVMTAGAALAFSLIDKSQNSPWPAAKAAIIYTLLRLAVLGFLFMLGHSLAIVPPIIFPALVFDLGKRRQLAAPMLAILFALAVYLSYLPYLYLFLNGFSIQIFDILLGILLAGIVSFLMTKSLEIKLLPNASVLALISFTLLFGFALPSLAHDPGQGEDIGQARLLAYQTNGRLSLRVELIDVDCSRFSNAVLLARRAGEILETNLNQTGDCQFSAEISLAETGRWFIYADFDYEDNKAEAWLPVIIETAETEYEKLSSLYVPTASVESSGQVLNSVILYLINFSLFASAIAIFRHALRGT
jgi:hypothetical protein